MILFKDKIKNILDKQKSVTLRFLNLEEQSYLKNIKDVTLYGGYKDAEKKRAYFFQEKATDIVCFKINYSDKYLDLTHQNILGTLLSLGITFDSIGDILPKQGVFFVTEEISKEVIESFIMINHTPISLSIYNSSYITNEIELEEHQTTVESMRLDLVISKITKTSRNNASLMIQKEHIKINHQVHTKPTTSLKENDIISIRKYGRILIQDTSKRSKKGKIVLLYSKYM